MSSSDSGDASPRARGDQAPSSGCRRGRRSEAGVPAGGPKARGRASSLCAHPMRRGEEPRASCGDETQTPTPGKWAWIQSVGQDAFMHFSTGLDVSLAKVAICVVDRDGLCETLIPPARTGRSLRMRSTSRAREL
jgi:hypothetical protein